MPTGFLDSFQSPDATRWQRIIGRAHVAVATVECLGIEGVRIVRVERLSTRFWVFQNSSLIPKRNQSSKKPSRAKIAKVPLKKRVITPPMTQPPQTDENSPPETMKPRVKTPPTETSTLEPATPSSEFPMGNQTMSAEKIFRPISETDSELEDL